LYLIRHDCARGEQHDTASIDHQRGPNAKHSRANRWGCIRLNCYKKSLRFDLECDIINAKQWKIY
jgi:hypothetical protein